MSNKFHAEAVTVNGERFGSKLEARRWQELKLMEKAGEIVQLELHPEFKFIINSVLVGNYTADSAYLVPYRMPDRPRMVRVVEDVKQPATRTTAYRLRKKLVKALYGIEITEWPENPPPKPRKKRAGGPNKELSAALDILCPKRDRDRDRMTAAEYRTLRWKSWCGEPMSAERSGVSGIGQTR